MLLPPRHDILVSATECQIEAIAALVGTDNIQHLVMGDNGVPTFWHDGPEIMDQIAGLLPETEQARIKSWDELDPDTQYSVLSHAAGFQDLEDHHLETVLADRPDFKAALLHPASQQTP